MSDYDNFLIRKVLHNGREVDLSFMIEATVAETIDLSGPRIMMKFNDQYSLLRDELRIEPGDILEIAVPMGADISDPEYPDLYFAYEDYRVLTMPVMAKGEVVINCMHNDIWEWKKTIAKNPRIFLHRNPIDIIRAWEPAHGRWDILCGDRVGCSESNPFVATEDYHFLPGERVSLTMQQMALEHAALFFLTRGERFHCRLKKQIVKEEPLFTYDHYDEDIPKGVKFDAFHGQIQFYARPYTNTILEDLMVRYLTGFHMIDGPMYADKNIDAPLKFRPQKFKLSLNNLNVNLIPAVEFTAVGNSYLTVGHMMKLNWYESDKHHPIDESLPDKALIGTVIHHYSAQKYSMRVKLVNLAEWVEE